MEVKRRCAGSMVIMPGLKAFRARLSITDLLKDLGDLNKLPMFIQAEIRAPVQAAKLTSTEASRLPQPRSAFPSPHGAARSTSLPALFGIINSSATRLQNVMSHRACCREGVAPLKNQQRV